MRSTFRNRVLPGFLSNRRDKGDWLIAVSLFALTVATRLPFRTEMLFHWDSANFALALDRFDVTRYAPQPPGYLYYVALAKAISFWAADANLSLVVESILFSALTVSMVYLLGKVLFGPAVGLTAGLLVMSSVTFWSYGEIAFPYVALAFFSTVVAYLAWRSLSSPAPRWIGISLAYAVGGGFRQDLLPFLAPIWLLSLGHGKVGRKGWIGALLIVLTGFLAWYLPTAQLSGGSLAYWRALLAQGGRVSQEFAVSGQGMGASLSNLVDLLRYIFYALYAQALLLLPAAIGLLLQGQALIRSEERRKAAFFALWIAPMILFYVFIHIGDAGYVFTFMPAVHILLAASLVWLVKRLDFPGPAVLSGAMLFLLLANGAIFFFHPRILTAAGLRARDQLLRQELAYIRQNHRPDSTVLLSTDTFRHWVYYLPSYRSYWVDYLSPQTQELTVPEGVSRIVLMDEGLASINRNPARTTEVRLPGGARVYVLAVAAGQRLIYSRDALMVQ